MIDKNFPPTDIEVDSFIATIDFKMPQGFMEFYKENNGAFISAYDAYFVLWPLTELIKLNTSYKVATYAPDFFIFGSNGGDIAYAIEKVTGYIFEMPFIGMSKEEAVFKSKNLNDLIEATISR